MDQLPVLRGDISDEIVVEVLDQLQSTYSPLGDPSNRQEGMPQLLEKGPAVRSFREVSQSPGT
jgi:hypothetical protein